MRNRIHWRVISRAPGNIVVVGEVDGPIEHTTDPRKWCNCERNVKYGIQCVHEMVADGVCDLSKYADRWFCCTRSFLSREVDLPTSPQAGDLQVGDSETIVNDLDSVDDDGNDLDAGDIGGNGKKTDDEETDDDDDGMSLSRLVADLEKDKENEVEFLPPSSQQIRKDGRSYQSIMEKMQNLARAVHGSVNDQESLYANIEEMTSRLRSGHSLRLVFDLDMEDVRPSPVDAQRVVPGSKRVRANAANMNRLQSRNEIARTHARTGAKKSRNTPSVSPFLGNDLMHVTHGQSTTKTCGICRQQGHQRNNCERVTHWKFPPLVRSGELVTRQRRDLATKLHWIPPVDCPEVENGCPISDSVPYRVKGVVIHKQMCSATLPFLSCFECTLLDKNILPVSSFTNKIFTGRALAAYVTKSLTSLVICQAQIGRAELSMSQQISQAISSQNGDDMNDGVV